MTEPTKFTLTEDRIPTHWVNLLPDLPGDPLPPLNPGTMEPAGPDDLTPIFPMALIGQEVSAEPEVEIPEPVREVYKLWRPTPLYRARRLERELDTPARIYYKYEGVSPAGSHKPNSAVAQAYANKEAGIDRLVTETGAGQWGSALALASQPVRARVPRLHGRRELRPEALPAGDDGELGRDGDPLAQRHHRVRARPGRSTRPARSASRSRRPWRWRPRTPDTNYALGSVLNHVCLHQTVIGQEALAQMEMAGEEPDVVVGLRRRRLELRRDDVPVPPARAARRGAARASWRPSRPPARRSRAAPTATTSATPSASRR